MPAVEYPKASSLGLVRYKCVQRVAYVNPLALTDLPMCPSYSRCATVGKASPECQVGRSSRNVAQCVLCELRPQEPLGSSVFAEVSWVLDECLKLAPAIAYSR